MILLDKGDVFFGKNYTDMVNKAIGTTYKGTQYSGFFLDKYGLKEVIAWFVYMDGTTHGYDNGWKWQNILTNNGVIIREMNISTDKNILYYKRLDKGYMPYRLAFQIDPFETGNKYACKFVGAFRLKSFLKPDMSIIEYEKIADSVFVNNKNYGYRQHLVKNDFLQEPTLLNTKIQNMNFDKEILSKLQSWKIKTAADLLEYGICLKEEMNFAINSALYDLLKK